MKTWVQRELVAQLAQQVMSFACTETSRPDVGSVRSRFRWGRARGHPYPLSAGRRRAVGVAIQVLVGQATISNSSGLEAWHRAVDEALQAERFSHRLPDLMAGFSVPAGPGRPSGAWGAAGGAHACRARSDRQLETERRPAVALEAQGQRPRVDLPQRSPPQAQVSDGARREDPVHGGERIQTKALTLIG